MTGKSRRLLIDAPRTSTTSSAASPVARRISAKTRPTLNDFLTGRSPAVSRIFIVLAIILIAVRI